ncbi:MAG: hypothetical protein ACXW04_06030 [Methylobacter sp.]
MTSDPTTNLASLQNNPFSDDTISGATTELTVYNSNTCIVYAYNRDNDSPPVIDSDERLGFRLNNAGELEMRSSGDTNEDCDDGDWLSITEPEVEITGLTFTLTTTILNVSSMATDTDNDGCYDGDDQDSTTASSSCETGNYGNNLCDTGESCNTCARDGSPDPACLTVRNVAISLTGRLRDDNAVTQTITEQVKGA